MRTVVLAAAAAVALTVPAASQTAATATKTITIKATAFSPTSRTITTGDAIKWTNGDTKNHQVVANNGSFASGTIGPNKSYTHTFNTAGTFNFHDALHPTLKGKIIVKGPPPAITIGVSAPIIDYGQSTQVAGAVSSKKSGETVTVYAQPYGQVSPVQIATLLTGANGAWALPIKPTLLTTYTAHWKTLASQPVGVQLRPAVSFSAAKRWGSVKVKADRSLQGRKLYLQKFTRFHEWVKVRTVVLGSNSQKRFQLELRPGYRYAVRIFMSLNQVGAGYLDGFSTTHVIRVPKG
ncbi:MAG TPA: cupredoxin domain-containing protein [Gaiellaceae bacterium]|jgi:plastocyanin